jgi:hypothetical protein
MSALSLDTLRQQLELDVRSAGRDGLTTAADLRHFLGQVLRELATLETAQAAQALASRPIAEAITQDYVRTAYPDAQAALTGAGDHGTATVYSLAYGAATESDPNRTVVGLVFPTNTLTTNLLGLSLYTPDANTDVMTFTGGTHVINAHHTTIVTHPVLHQQGLGQGWTISAIQGAPQDITIHDLNLLIQGHRTHGLYFRAAGRCQFSGDITLQRVPALAAEAANARWAVHNQRGTLLGKGSLTAYGNDATTGAVGIQHRLFVVGPAASVTWEGSIRAYDDVAIELSAQATLVLREGLLDARARTGGAGPLFATALGTVVLENYSLLVAPGEEAIHADTIILRGNSVVVGTLNAAHILDERPAAAGPLPTLEFVFGNGYADSYTATCGYGQAGHYTGQHDSNVKQASYVRNGTEQLTMPFTLATGDTLAVAITRVEASQPAVLSLQAS